MNKTLIFSLLLISGFVFGQSNIEGIGKFKVGKTNIKIIDSLSKNGFPKVDCTDFYFSCLFKNYSKKLIIEPVGEMNKKYNLVENNKVYFLTNYTVAEIEIKALKLFFYNDLLYKIESEEINPKLYTALREKYKPTVNLKSNEIQCSSVLGNFTKIEENKTFTYRDDEIITAKEFDNRFYNSKCKEDGIYNISIKYNSVANSVENLEKPLLIELKNNLESKNAKKLEDL